MKNWKLSKGINESLVSLLLLLSIEFHLLFKIESH